MTDTRTPLESTHLLRSQADPTEGRLSPMHTQIGTTMKKAFPALAVAGALVLAPTVAFAGGSNDPTPYTVHQAGITLPEGDVFVDGGHVNIRTTANVGYGLHFEDRNWPADSTRRAFIGKSFLPWSAFGIPAGQACIQWVQVAGYNEHFGEGGQTPTGPDCAAPADPEDPKTTPTGEPTPDPSNPPVTEEPTETPTPTEEPTVPEPTEEPTETPDPEPSEVATPTPTPTVPLNPAGGDMKPLLIGGGIAAMVAGVGVLIARLRSKEKDA